MLNKINSVSASSIGRKGSYSEQKTILKVTYKDSLAFVGR